LNTFVETRQTVQALEPFAYVKNSAGISSPPTVQFSTNVQPKKIFENEERKFEIPSTDYVEVFN
jgi:hypothetical protein